MKNRDYKNFAQDGYYHLFNRGNGKQNIFVDDEDKKFFLYRLKENLFPQLSPSPEGSLLGNPKAHTPYVRKLLPSGSFTLLCYCLMPNHVHFLLRQNSNLSISKIISKVFTGYGKYFNKKYGKVGHVFQGPIKAIKVVSDSQLMWLTAYIHTNPIVSGLVTNLNFYEWSSFLDYTGKRKGVLCDKDFILKMFPSAQAYEEFVNCSIGKIKERKDLGYLLLED